MARFFGRHPSQATTAETQGVRDTLKSRTIQNLLRRAKKLFRSRVHIEPSSRIRPLPILATTERAVGLQDAIDAELLLLSESPFTSSANASISTTHSQRLVGMQQTSEDLASTSKDAARSHMTPRESISSDSCETSHMRSKYPGYWTEDSTHFMDKALLSSTQSSYFGSSGEPSGLEVNQTPQPDTTTAQKVTETYSNGDSAYYNEVYRHARSIPACSAENLEIFTNASSLEEEFALGLEANGFLHLFDEPSSLAVTEEGHPEAVAYEEPLNGIIMSDAVYSAQPQRELEVIRRIRARFAKHFEMAAMEQKADLVADFTRQLAEQKDRLESCFEERYDNTAKLHNTNMLNLQDDHDAVVEELKLKTKDQQARLAKGEKAIRDLKREMKSTTEKYDLTKTELRDRSRQCNQLFQVSQERETILQRWKEELHQTRDELARNRRESEASLRTSQEENSRLYRSHRDLIDTYNGLMTGFNNLDSNRQSTEARLEAVQGQLETTKGQLVTAQAALQARNQDCEDLRARHDHVVAEKAQDFSWNIKQSEHPFALKPMNLEDKIAEATKQLGESLQEQTAESADLRHQLESALDSRKARVKKLKRVIANQNQEIVILQMALSIAQEQRDHWAEKHNEIAEALTSKLAFSSFASGLGERHQALQKTRLALEAQLLEYKIRGDRAVLKCEIQKRHESIKLEKRDAELAALRHQLGDAVLKYDNEHTLALLYEETIEQKMPELQSRNAEVEQLLQDQIMNNVHANHKAVFDDMRKRVHDLECVNQYWEHEINQSSQKYAALQTSWGFFSSSVYSDLTNARSWRNELDRVELENVTLRERFAVELVGEPLIIPEHRKTRQQIEDDFKLENIDNLLLKQFGETYGALAKELVAKNARPWEHIRFELKEDIAKQKMRWIVERDALDASFKDKSDDRDGNADVNMVNDHELMDDGESEVVWKGKGKQKMSGEMFGNDGQLIALGCPSGENNAADFF